MDDTINDNSYKIESSSMWILVQVWDTVFYKYNYLISKRVGHVIAIITYLKDLARVGSCWKWKLNSKEPIADF